MSVLLFVLAAFAAAYLLWPLYRPRAGVARRRRAAGGRRAGSTRTLLLLAAGFLITAAPSPAEAAGDEVTVGLMLIAVDAQRDHLRVSEALRIANPGPARELDLSIALPRGAQYLTYHRGVRDPAPTPGGFRARLVVERGVTELVYSYALPAGRTLALARAFALPVARMELVVRGRGVRLGASHGQRIDDVRVGGESLPRWEARGVRAGETVTFTLSALPVSQPWLPAAAASLFALALAGGLLVAATRGVGARRPVEE